MANHGHLWATIVRHSNHCQPWSWSTKNNHNEGHAQSWSIIVKKSQPRSTNVNHGHGQSHGQQFSTMVKHCQPWSRSTTFNHCHVHAKPWSTIVNDSKLKSIEVYGS